MSLIGQELSVPLAPVRLPGGGHEATGEPRDSDAVEAAALLAAAREVRSVSTSHFPPSTPGLWP
ncbi:hypothetical protein DLJ96_19675, partial [Actinotalea fermentans ATCC 43279 = JCM 9966 = DSM 3133]